MRVPHLIGATVRGGVLVAVAWLLPPATVNAQDAPAHLAYVEGAVSLDRDSETIDAVNGEPLLPGDRLRTGAGLVEIWFPDGSALDLDAYSTFELASSSLLRLTEGRLILMVARRADSSVPPSYQIDTPWGTAVTNGSGEYRVSLTAGSRDGSIELAVVRGAAQLTSDGGSIELGSGERAFARADGAPSRPEAFNAARMDTFGRWASNRRDERLGNATSSRYLPPNLQMYGSTFDRYGAWEYDAANGDVWYPTVDPGWRPYYNGYWSPLPTYGWTWIASDGWGWPTHHYGRWGFARSRWFWRPERRWAPAWVSWATAPDFVSWCPIGLDNRPVFNLSVSAGNHWAGWVVLPRSSFGGRNFSVSRHAVEGRRIPRNTAFVGHSQAPIPASVRGRGYVSGAPAGGLAVSRDPRGEVERRVEPVNGRAPSASPRADRGNRQDPGVRTAGPETRAASAIDRERASRRGLEGQTASQPESVQAPRVYGARPVTPRDRDATASGSAVRRGPRDPGPVRIGPPDGQAGTVERGGVPRTPQGRASREATPQVRPPDSALAGRPTYSRPAAPARPPAAQPQTSPRVDQDPRDRDPSRARSGDRPNRRSGEESSAQAPRPSPVPRPAERVSAPRETARPAPARDAPPPRAQPRSEGPSGGGGGVSRGRDSGGSGGRRSP